MDFHFETYRIECTHPFGISRSSHSYYDIVFIYLEFDGLVGRGEAAPSNRYNESTERIIQVLDNEIVVPDNIYDIDSFCTQLSDQCENIKALEAAFSMAALDLWCQINKKPLYAYFNADPDQTPQTSFTISIGDMDLLPQKIKEADPYNILKVNFIYQ